MNNRYIYGFVLPILLIIAVLGVMTWLEHGPLAGALILLSPPIAVVLTVLISIYIAWLDNGDEEER